MHSSFLHCLQSKIKPFSRKGIIFHKPHVECSYCNSTIYRRVINDDIYLFFLENIVHFFAVLYQVKMHGDPERLWLQHHQKEFVSLKITPPYCLSGADNDPKGRWLQYNITRRNFIFFKSLHPTVYQVKMVIQKDGDYNITRRNLFL